MLPAAVCLCVTAAAQAQQPPPAPALPPAPPASDPAQALAQAPRFGETLLLGLKINGLPQPQTVRAVRVPEGLAIPQALWTELKFRPPRCRRA
ncbi:hypothetical protein ACQ859_28080 [Roseateles chitinivorans]|uniref:hypothetical protein n=1 Tax=Roseateles chitinivorans TaxID=2917965 RepID=UPI003D66797A